jgi:hypothetical protein
MTTTWTFSQIAKMQVWIRLIAGTHAGAVIAKLSGMSSRSESNFEVKIPAQSNSYFCAFRE